MCFFVYRCCAFFCIALCVVQLIKCSQLSFLLLSAAKYNGEIYKRRLMVELPTKGGLPLQPMGNSRPSLGNMSSMTPPMTTNPMASNPMISNTMNPNITQMNSVAPMPSMMPMTSMTPMTSLAPMSTMTPMTSLGPLTPEPVATYITEMPNISAVSTLPTERHIAGVGGGGGLKPNGHKPKSTHGHVAHTSHGFHTSHTHVHSHSSKSPGLGAPSLAHMAGTMPGGTSLGISRAAGTTFGSSSATMGRPLAYSSNTIAAGHAMGLGLKGWDGTETVGRRKNYGHKRPQCTILEPNPLHGSRGHSHSQHYLPTQPYFVTNSKTEVTVWERENKGKDSCGLVAQVKSWAMTPTPLLDTCGSVCVFVWLVGIPVSIVGQLVWVPPIKSQDRCLRSWGWHLTRWHLRS